MRDDYISQTAVDAAKRIVCAWEKAYEAENAFKAQKSVQGKGDEKELLQPEYKNCSRYCTSNADAIK